ncbi:unnamed protein product [Acanthoscelides obtectus]|uniref:Uncharacterized protein n=1 Tax=Acanthoscelides obtectus TaxID=200917 RepID=A0A9P0Q1B6_ACAOB|nr:unnamed protein product [Acanthoscelides obtectus]CAK1636107.1 hypothetical protein AOBTE_LOCUS9748 [Acanthoscelides obtectus]
MWRENFIINLLDAIIIHMAWQKVSKETILNCFTHGGFLEVEDHFDPDDDLPLVEWMKKIQQEDDLRDNIRTNLPYSENDFNKFVHIDDRVVTVEYLYVDAIVAAISSAVDTDDDEKKENKDEESMSMELIPTPTTSEALRHFLQSRNTPQRVLDRLAEVELHINDMHFTNKKNE